MTTTLLVATTNRKKLAEMEALLKDLDLKLTFLQDVGPYEEVPENGKSFEENASLKAIGYAKQTGFLTLAEDSGLCCHALDGAPGIYSARFAGAAKTDLENNLKVLKLLKPLPDNCRTGYFKSAVAIAEPERVVGVVSGEVHGVLAHEMVGSNGFGYDPIFFYPPYKKTFGEVSAEMKHRVSHRAQALAKAKKLLAEYLLTGPGPAGLGPVKRKE